MYTNEQIATLNYGQYKRALALGRISTAGLPRDEYVRRTVDGILNAGPMASGVTDAQIRRYVKADGRRETGYDLDDMVEAIRAKVNEFMGWKV